jgi:hypothetical protein
MKDRNEIMMVRMRVTGEWSRKYGEKTQEPWIFSRVGNHSAQRRGESLCTLL